MIKKCEVCGTKRVVLRECSECKKNCCKDCRTDSMISGYTLCNKCFDKLIKKKEKSI